MAGWQRTRQVDRNVPRRAGVAGARRAGVAGARRAEAPGARRGGVDGAAGVRLLGAATVLLGGLSVLPLAAAQAGPAAAAASRGWVVEATPNPDPTGTGINELSAVSCSSPSACTAVGSGAASQSSPGFPVAERWDGRRWQLQRTALPRSAQSGELAGVSCPTPAACTAVGSMFGRTTHASVSLAEAWNGIHWAVSALPAVPGSTGSLLLAVSCTTPSACTAVGSAHTAAGLDVALAERWDGATWRLQAVPKAAGTRLFGVSCPAAHACAAVGYSTGASGTRPVAESWNGASWRLRPVPLPTGSPGGMLAAVSCPTPTACTASGANFAATGPTLAERWNGTRWSVERTPAPADAGSSHQEVELNAISCASATACTATGAYAPGGNSAYFLEAWNGRSWRLVAVPHPAGFRAGALGGVGCAAARCTAVGAFSGGPTAVATLAMAG